jgi:hypothetical protein
MIGYWLYSHNINNKQAQIDALRTELGSGLEPARGITPEYLQQNESVAAVLEEIELLKKEAGKPERLANGFLVWQSAEFSADFFC